MIVAQFVQLQNSAKFVRFSCLILTSYDQLKRRFQLSSVEHMIFCKETLPLKTKYQCRRYHWAIFDLIVDGPPDNINEVHR